MGSQTCSLCPTTSSHGCALRPAGKQRQPQRGDETHKLSVNGRVLSNRWGCDFLWRGPLCQGAGGVGNGLGKGGMAGSINPCPLPSSARLSLIWHALTSRRPPGFSRIIRRAQSEKGTPPPAWDSHCHAVGQMSPSTNKTREAQ